MKKQEVKLEFDVNCQGSQGDTYRTYLNDELLSERQWRFTKDYKLTENAPLKVESGKYTLRIERVEPATGIFTINNIKVNTRDVEATFYI